MNELHPVRAQILYALRHTQTARFSELMKQSNLESDTFKFHIRALKDQGYIDKRDDGAYALTAHGKELANNLDANGQHNLKQPKLSLLIVASRVGADGITRYLMQQRMRQPFYGYWGCLSGPAQWGEDFEETARLELKKQCGALAETCVVRTFYRQQDYNKANTLLEDKLFVVIEATIKDNTTTDWHGGETTWLSLHEIQSQTNIFPTSLAMLVRIDKQEQLEPLIAAHTQYSDADY